MVQSPIEVPNIVFEAIVGSGGFGDVWSAHHTGLDRRVAVKVSGSPLSSEATRSQFKRDFEALASYSEHPGILDIHASGVNDDGYAYLITEFIERGTLADISPPLSEQDLVELGVDMCDAIAATHAANIFHRDLKPANVFFRDSGQPVVGDFGLAKLYTDESVSSDNLVATVAFASPEMLRGDPAVAASDIYGIAITLASAAIGRSPFVSDTRPGMAATIDRVLTDEPHSLVDAPISDQFIEVLLKGLAKDPDDRPKTALGLGSMLQEVASSMPKSATEFPSRHVDSVPGNRSDTNPVAAQAPSAQDVDAGVETASEAGAKEVPERITVGVTDNDVIGLPTTASESVDVVKLAVTTTTQEISQPTVHEQSVAKTGSGRKLLVTAGLLLVALLGIGVVISQLDRLGSSDENVRAATTISPVESTTIPSVTGPPVGGDPEVVVAEPTPAGDDELAGGSSDQSEESGDPAQSTVPTTPTASTTTPTTVASALPTVQVFGPLIEPSDQTVTLDFNVQVTSIRHVGKLQGDDTHLYILDGTAGQKLDVSFISRSGDGDVKFSIVDPAGRTIIRGRTGSASIDLKVDGQFVVELAPRVNKEAQYDVQFSLREP